MVVVVVVGVVTAGPRRQWLCVVCSAGLHSGVLHREPGIAAAGSQDDDGGVLMPPFNMCCPPCIEGAAS